MARDDDEPVAPKTSHIIGQDLSALSLEDIDQRIEWLRAEISRLETARAGKAASRAAADAFFKTS